MAGQGSQCSTQLFKPDFFCTCFCNINIFISLYGFQINKFANRESPVFDMPTVIAHNL